MTRTEHDLLGALEVPAEAYYGIHAARAMADFALSGLRVHPELVRSLALVKKAAALANQRTSQLPGHIAEAICQACDDVVGGGLDDQFPLDPLQGGAGTSTNMNMNEVLANRAIEILGGRKGDYSLVHPNDHVNLSQSTNDAYPTAVKVAAVKLLRLVIEDMGLLQGALQAKEAEFAGVLKVGRTEMQDAVPVTLGQEFAAWAQAVQRDWWRLHVAEEKLRQVNLGGTAVGTGLCADPRYVLSVVDILRDLTGIGLARAENMMDVTQNADVFVEVSGLLKTAASTLAKIASDLRLLSSGPRAGLGEIALPEQQAGSSIMPGKVNPVITEAVTQISYQVMANDLAITMAAQAGQLELNAFLPLIAHNLFQQLDLLHDGVTMFMERCIRGIEARPAVCRAQVEGSFGLVTAIAPYVGYEAASEVAREAAQTGRSVKRVLLDRGLFTDDELDIVLSPQEMTKPGISGARQLKERGRTPQSRPRGAGGDMTQTLNETPLGSRLHIGIFGRRNAGKSSLINALTNQEAAIVSEIPGTTTDPVRKAMEIQPLGPVVIIDTAGIDDTGLLGEARIRHTLRVLDRTDLALLVLDPQAGVDRYEDELAERIASAGVPLIAVANKSDLGPPDGALVEWALRRGVPLARCSAKTREGIDIVKTLLVKHVPSGWVMPTIIGDLVRPGDAVVLVVPVDKAAPKGRLILPQVMTIRDVIDNDAYAIVVKERELQRRRRTKASPIALQYPRRGPLALRLGRSRDRRGGRRPSHSG